MEVIELLIRTCLGTLFLTSSFSKMRKMYVHVSIVQDYGLLPQQLVPIFARTEVTIEFIISLCLLFGLFQTFTLFVVLALLIIYTTAITVNLIRGRKEISCGCGGLIGSHQLSWWLVLRNIIFMVPVTWMIVTPKGSWGSLHGVIDGASINQVFDLTYWLTMVITYSFIGTVLFGIELFAIYRRMNAMISGE